VIIVKILFHVILVNIIRLVWVLPPFFVDSGGSRALSRALLEFSDLCERNTLVRCVWHCFLAIFTDLATNTYRWAARLG
jgi:hypothetical protein